jgi:hypothetical protein
MAARHVAMCMAVGLSGCGLLFPGPGGAGGGGSGGGEGGGSGACTGTTADAAYQGSSALALTELNGTNLCITDEVRTGVHGALWVQEHNPPDGNGSLQLQVLDGCRRVDVRGRGTRTAAGQGFTLVPNGPAGVLQLGQAYVQYSDTCTGAPRLWTSQSGTLTVGTVGPSVATPNVAGAYAVTFTLSDAAMAPIEGANPGQGTFKLAGPWAFDPMNIDD